MYSTALPFLQNVSNELGEASTILTAERIGFFNSSVEQFYSDYLFRFRVKIYSLALDGSSEYNLSTLISDYDSGDGVYLIVDENEVPIDPIDIKDKGTTFNKVKYYIFPNKSIIGFTSDDGNKTYKIYYYARHIYVSTESETLNVSIPQYAKRPIVSLILSRVYRRKRQRYDERNILLNYKEELSSAIAKDSRSGAIGSFPKIIPSTRKLLGI